MKYKKTVCIDLDGVLAEYDGWKGPDHIGQPIKGSIEFVRNIAAYAKVVIYTARCNAENRSRGEMDAFDSVRLWLQRYGFPYDEVYTGAGKPIASAYVDDRAVVCLPQEDIGSYNFALMKIKERIGVENE